MMNAATPIGFQVTLTVIAYITITYWVSLLDFDPRFLTMQASMSIGFQVLLTVIAYTYWFGH
jgi:hypothetical protein